MQIPLSGPDITEEEIKSITEVLKTPNLSFGPKLQEFEDRFAKYIGLPHAVAVNSGTSGLHLTVIATGIGNKDLVITTPFSFIASSNAILYEQAVPIFVDIDPQTLNIDPDLVAEACDDIMQDGTKAKKWLPPAFRKNSNGKLKAIIPVHVFGQPADMGPLIKIARKYQLSVIEDACEAIGAEYKGKKAGILGDAGVFGFYPNKQMTTGEGGMIITNKRERADIFRSLRNQGRDNLRTKFNHIRLGYNYRLDEMSAALGLVQLSRIEELLSKRERVASWYNERLKDVEDLKIPYIVQTTTRMSWFVYVVRLDPKIDQEWVIKKLEEKGIPSRTYFMPLHLQPFYVERFGYQNGSFPNTEAAGKTCLLLPFFGNMKEEQVEYVCQNLIKILQDYLLKSRR